MARLILPVKNWPQPRIGECLPACAAMVLDHIGIVAPYHRLLRILETIPDLGTPSFRVVNLERLGVKVSYQQGTLDALFQHLLAGRPCIVFVRTGQLPYRTDNTDHAVVLVGMDEQSVYINDPETTVSPLRVSLGDFDLAWLERDEMYAVITRQ
jgi:ABC-type bacteriocin/lantibiotic exporter with double-glycine peptidase domain